MLPRDTNFLRRTLKISTLTVQRFNETAVRTVCTDGNIRECETSKLKYFQDRPFSEEKRSSLAMCSFVFN